MVQWASAFSKLLDPYDLKARLLPGLLLIAPVITFIGLVLGPKDPVVATLVSIVGACGGPYFLASFVRTHGQSAQTRLHASWGAQPTTILMRARDARLPPQTKQRYRELAAYKLGLTMPSPDEEAADPHTADQAYAALADALRPLTNDKAKFPFVFKELVSYGFNRNAYGVRWLGAVISALTAVAVVVHGLGPDDLRHPALVLKLDRAHAITALVCVLLLLIWAFHFTARTVEQAGYSYALRLWEALEKVPKKATKTK